MLSGLAAGPLEAASGHAADLCKTAPSPACVTAALRARIEAGYGVWLTAVTRDFDGTFIANVPVDKRNLESIDRHFKELKRTPQGVDSMYAGIDFKNLQQAPALDLGSEFSQISYQGVRTLLIVALSRDATMGRKFAERLTKRLREDEAPLIPGKMRPEDAVITIELAPLEAPEPEVKGAKKAPMGPPESGGQGDIKPDQVKELEVRGVTNVPPVTVIDTWCGGGANAWINVDVASRATAVPLPAYFKQSTRLEGPFGEVPLPPQVGLAQPLGTGFRIFTSCGPLKEQAHPWIIAYDLKRKIDLDSSALADAWFARASAPNAWEMPEKTYGLSELVRSLLSLRAAEVTLGRVCLQVKRDP